MPHDQFLQNLEQNRQVADQLFRDLDKQFRLMRRMWKKMDAKTLIEQLEQARVQIEGIEVLIGINRKVLDI